MEAGGTSASSATARCVMAAPTALRDHAQGRLEYCPGGAAPRVPGASARLATPEIVLEFQGYAGVQTLGYIARPHEYDSHATVLAALMLVSAVGAASAYGHAERLSYYPNHKLGSVPKYKRTGPALVVCKSTPVHGSAGCSPAAPSVAISRC